jgi:hypothetical protein
MNARFVGLLVAALACTVTDLHGQSDSLPRPQRELGRLLRTLKQTPPTSAGQPVPVVRPLPAESYSGPVEKWPVVIMGRVTNPEGQPEVIVLVQIQEAAVGARTRVDGTYRFIVPRGYFRPGEKVTVTVSRRGSVPASQSVILQPGTRVRQDFTLALIRLH